MFSSICPDQELLRLRCERYAGGEKEGEGENKEDGEGIDDSSFPSHRGGYSRSKLSSLWAGSWRNLSELDQWTIMLRDGLFVDGISLQGYCESKQCSDDLYNNF